MNLSGRKGPNVHTEFKEKPNFICHRFKNLKGRKSASALLSFSRQSGEKKKKTTAGVGRETAAVRVRVAPLSTSNLRRHYRHCARLWKKCPPLWLKWIFLFFFLLSSCITDLLTVCFLIVTKGHRAERRETHEPDEEGDGATTTTTREEKNELISSGCRRMEMSWNRNISLTRC